VDVPIYDDVKDLTHDKLESQGIFPTVITAGFPCQDISQIGNRTGIHGKQSQLFFEVVKLVREIRPDYCILENVSALLKRGIGDVFGEFSKIGYDCEWHCITASSIGAPHRRDRVWIIGRNTDSNCKSTLSINDEASRLQKYGRNANCKHEQQEVKSVQNQNTNPIGTDRNVPRQIISKVKKTNFWSIEPDVDRVVDGVSPRLDRRRLKQLGKSVVPQIPEIIGNAIIEYERKTHEHL